MSRHDNPGLLPAAFGLALACIVATCLLVPRAWVAWWLVPYAERSAGDGGGRRGPLELLPPPEFPPDVVSAVADSLRGPEIAAPVTLGPAELLWRAAWAEYRAADTRLRPAVLGEDSLRALTRQLLLARPADLLRAPADTSRAARLAFLRVFYGEDLLRRLPQLEAAIHGRRAAEVISREIDIFGEQTLRR
jgi:hypothetical protein